NKDILKKMDSELSKAEDELLNAKGQIENGKSKMDTEEKSQMNQLIQDEEAITEGKEEMAEAENGINAGLMELNRSREELISIKSLIEKGEEGLLEIERKINFLGEDLSPEMKAVFESIQERVEDGLDELPVDKEAIRQDINNGIRTIDEKTKELNSHKSQLKEQKSELLSKESEISKGKNLLTSEMSKARFELMDGEKKLDEKMGEFEEAKEEAFKKASLDG